MTRPLKVSLALLASLQLVSADFIKDAGEVPRSQDLKKIFSKIEKTRLKVDPDEYVFKLKKYAAEHNLSIPQNQVHQKIVALDNKDFSLPERPFRYKLYVTNTLLDDNQRARLDLIKKGVLEAGEWDVLEDLAFESMKRDCERIHEENRAKQKEMEKKKIVYVNWKPKKCALEQMTVLDRRNYREKLFRDFLKYLMLKNLYLTKDLSKKELRELIRFYRSPEWQKFIETRRRYTREILLPEKSTATSPAPDAPEKNETIPASNQSSPEDLLEMKLF